MLFRQRVSEGKATRTGLENRFGKFHSVPDRLNSGRVHHIFLAMPKYIPDTTPEEDEGVEMALELCPRVVLNRINKKRLPTISFMYYKDRACIAEIARRLKMAQATISSMIDSGVCARFSELYFGDSTPLEHIKQCRSTQARWR